MQRRRFLTRAAYLLGMGGTVLLPTRTGSRPLPSAPPESDRAYCIRIVERLALPVLEALSRRELRARMPLEKRPGSDQDRGEFAHLEACGRLLAGLAPWLELGPDDTPEGRLRKKYIDLAREAIAAGVDPASPDHFNFGRGGQPLVDAAFLAHAFLRAPGQLWGGLPEDTKRQVVAAFQTTRAVTPPYNNWLLFAALIEAFFLKFSGSAWDPMRVDLALRKHYEWYLGDGVFADGPEFHWDYYNSYVIQPMLLDILRVLREAGISRAGENFAAALAIARRCAVIQERLISPTGTFPPLGRSITYRTGAFQLLAQIALWRELPEELLPAQVRGALTAVVGSTLDVAGTFDEQGWLRMGLAGHQPGLAESYISTGSLYLCATGFLALGLPPDDAFWTDPPAPWTQQRIWSGQDLPRDEALKGVGFR